jgi:TetR/AcrR family transcriptional regulator, tetracycline repressor protein
MRGLLAPDGATVKPALTPEDVVLGALQLIDENGLAALSMRVLAKELGVYPTALYWHTGSKGELLNAVANAVLAEIRLPDDGRPTRKWLYEFGISFRETIQRHSNTAPLLGTTLIMTPALLPGLEAVLSRLEDIGYADEGLVRAYNAYIGYVLGYTINELSQKPDQVSADWENLAEEYLDGLPREDYPTVVENLHLLKNHAIAFRWKLWRDSTLIESYEFGLEVLLTGLESLAPR